MSPFTRLSAPFLILAICVAVATPRYALASDADSPIQVAKSIITSIQSHATAISTAASAAGQKTLLAKEFIGDPAVYALGQSAIKSITNSTVNWINSGFQGSPLYATDLKSTLLDAADQQAEKFVSEFKKQSAIDSPFRDQVAANVLRTYYLSTSRDGFYLQNPYTLNKISPDDKAFLQGDFTKGGFQAWFAATLNPQNNPITASDRAQDQLDRELSSLTSQIHEELAWGNGILSWRKCDVQGPSTGSTPPAAGTVSLTAHQTCFQSHIETPGTVIAGQLNHALGLGTDSLVSADEVDEVVGALMGQLMNHVLGNDGLGGLSQASAVNSGRSYFQQSDAPVNTGTSASGSGTGSISVVTSFLQILQNQAQQLQAYSDDWQKIADAANGAKAALQQSACTPDASAVIASQVQPVLTQAATVGGKIPALLNQISKIRSEALGAVSSQTPSQQTAMLQQANADYQELLSSGTLPSAQDLQYADEQSQETTVEPISLLTKMNQLAAQAKTCGPTP